MSAVLDRLRGLSYESSPVRYALSSSRPYLPLMGSGNGVDFVRNRVHPETYDRCLTRSSRYPAPVPARGSFGAKRAEPKSRNRYPLETRDQCLTRASPRPAVVVRALKAVLARIQTRLFWSRRLGIAGEGYILATSSTEFPPFLLVLAFSSTTLFKSNLLARSRT